MKLNQRHSNENPVALVTGAAKRIGAHIVRKLHESNFNVIIHYRNSRNEAESLCDELNLIRPHSASAIQFDLNNIDQLKKFMDQCVETWNGINLLVNNASEFFATPIGKTTEQHWHVLMNSNLTAPYFLSQAAAPHLQKTSGSIINITDINSQIPLKNYPVYCIAKAGLSMMTKSLAKELGPQIRVNAIAPGNTLWPEYNPEYNEARKKELIDTTSLKRKVDPEDIAKAVVFFTHQSSITGQILNVDCGRLLASST